ncbi:MAG: DedA family protein, partial [Actinomycetaceae bacterium]|nr:DedA family protein [Actinomycetaceae bacterium]
LFPPIPSEIILPLAGFTASKGQTFGLGEAIAWATVGSVVGAIILYGLAYWFGRERTRAILNWFPLTNESDVDRTEEFFEKYKLPAVFFGRMLPIFRSLISLPAGVVKMNFALFLVLTTIGSSIWNTLLIGAGFALGEQWHLVEEYVGILSKLVLIVIVALLAWWVIVRLKNRKKEV